MRDHCTVMFKDGAKFLTVYMNGLLSKFSVRFVFLDLKTVIIFTLLLSCAVVQK